MNLKQKILDKDQESCNQLEKILTKYNLSSSEKELLVKCIFKNTARLEPIAVKTRELCELIEKTSSDYSEVASIQKLRLSNTPRKLYKKDFNKNGLYAGLDYKTYRSNINNTHFVQQLIENVHDHKDTRQSAIDLKLLSGPDCGVEIPSCNPELIALADQLNIKSDMFYGGHLVNSLNLMYAYAMVINYYVDSRYFGDLDYDAKTKTFTGLNSSKTSVGDPVFYEDRKLKLLSNHLLDIMDAPIDKSYPERILHDTKARAALALIDYSLYSASSKCIKTGIHMQEEAYAEQKSLPDPVIGANYLDNQHRQAMGIYNLQLPLGALHYSINTHLCYGVGKNPDERNNKTAAVITDLIKFSELAFKENMEEDQVQDLLVGRAYKKILLLNSITYQ